MGIEELREKREKLKIASDITLNNMQIIADESSRVAQVAHHSGEILKNLDKEFESQTGLNKVDVKFLLFATALQLGRWVVLNKVNQYVTTQIDNSRLKDNDSSIKKSRKWNVKPVINTKKNMMENGHIIKVKNILHGSKLYMMVCRMM